MTAPRSDVTEAGRANWQALTRRRRWRERFDVSCYWGIYEAWEPGQYLIVYRVQLLSNASGENVCFLDVCTNGNTIAHRRPHASEFKPNDWQAMPVVLTLPRPTTIEYRLWPHGHGIALDRLYVFQLH